MATHAAWLGTFARDDVPNWERDDLDEPAFMRRPRRLALLKSGDLEEDFTAPGVSEIHWAPLATTWTDQPPGRPGVWHCRPFGSEGYAIVKTEYDHYGVLCYQPWGRSDIPPKRVPRAPFGDQKPELEWSDRAISEPKEPTS